MQWNRPNTLLISWDYPFKSYCLRITGTSADEIVIPINEFLKSFSSIEHTYFMSHRKMFYSVFSCFACFFAFLYFFCFLFCSLSHKKLFRFVAKWSETITFFAISLTFFSLPFRFFSLQAKIRRHPTYSTGRETKTILQNEKLLIDKRLISFSILYKYGQVLRIFLYKHDQPLKVNVNYKVLRIRDPVLLHQGSGMIFSGSRIPTTS
jgi:hypothetical protein